MTDAPEVLADQRGRIGLITLNRPRALNALSLGMVDAVDQALAAWADDPSIGAVVIRGAGGKAFCAGGDVRTIMTAPPGPAAEAGRRAFFAHEYRLNYRIHTYPKPFIALVDGITMGGGCGLSLHGSHVVATERTAVAMPETVLGLFPDVGGSWFLNRLPGEMGLYLGLIGTRLSGGDLVGLGLAQAYVPSAAIESVIEALAAEAVDGAAVDRVLARHQTAPPPSAVVERQAAVDRLFAGPTVEAILAALEASAEPFAAEAAAVIGRASPTSLKVTLRQLRGGRGLAIEEIFRIEYRLAVRLTGGPDFAEGVRAILIDKDNRPVWRPPTLADLNSATIEGYFAPLPAGETELTLS